MISSNNLEAEAYDWFVWWSGKCNARSFHWKPFVDALLKRLYDKEKDDVYEKFVHLKQKGSVSEYTHEWEVQATRQKGFTDEHLLKMYRCGLEHICAELKLYKPQTIEKIDIQQSNLNKNISSKCHHSRKTKTNNNTHVKNNQTNVGIVETNGLQETNALTRNCMLMKLRKS